MELSILIPVYNFDVNAFVSELHFQAEECGIDFEILCFDDASEERYKLINRNIQSLKKVVYRELEKNHGRSAIRNLLAREARAGLLLFFDCDSKIVSKDFIRNYKLNSSDKAVVFGGRCYEKAPPSDRAKFLRWYYGSVRESFPAEIRIKNPYRFFMTNNFMVPKKIFLSVLMNEDLKGYGHEDTVLARELKRRGIEIRQIENPLCHIGLEDAVEFLGKTEQGITNLAFLIRNNMLDEEVKIFRFYRAIAKMRMEFLIKFLGGLLWRKIEKNLLSTSPGLRYFDFFKLVLLVRKMDEIRFSKGTSR